ncbi:hypothetical protein QFC22_006719 [Naganishia vaughanmartiniae]|uniref:Uncharacterized protein n=1 Tax=Naganishia vaughanmartiniae TaxID=1424756 RepID=A0ACC2WFS2_9TREE|nr:hypothetical protein QFC22_006719 [Naganishia vaughanmartiniae]
MAYAGGYNRGVDKYRQAYQYSQEHAQSTSSGQGVSSLGMNGADVETMKVTVKDPSVAFRLLEPLSQAYEAHEKSTPLEDYTYNRFQVKFKAQPDMEAFLQTFYSHFPELDPSARRMYTRSGSADSEAPSQHTQICIPGFQLVRRNRSPDLPRNDGSMLQGGVKRKTSDEDLFPGTRKMDIPRYDGPAPEWELRGEFGKEDTDSYDMQPALQQTQHESFFSNLAGIAIEGRYAGNKPVRREYMYPPPGSVDKDGFAKPYVPAMIDTPTPANRVYHLNPLDPNIRKAQEAAHHLPVFSPIKRSVPVVKDALVPPDLSSDLPIDLQSQRKDPGSYHSPQQQLQLASIGMGGYVKGQADGLDKPMIQLIETTQTDLGWKSKQTAAEKERNQIRRLSPAKASPHSLRHILAPDTVPPQRNVNNEQLSASTSSAKPTRDAPWPVIYGSQAAISSSVGNAISGVADTHKTMEDYPAKSYAKNDMSAQCLEEYGRRAKEGAHNESSSPRRAGNVSRIQTPSDQIQHPGAPQEVSRVDPASQPVTANITQISTLYTLSADDLDAVIDDILAEDGFIPFVRARI